MELPLQISFRNMQSSPALERQIRDRADALDQLHRGIVACRVVIEARHRHHHQGHLYHIRVSLVVPGAEIVVSRDPSAAHAHEDAHVAVRDAFDAARRRLEDWARRQRGDTKTRAEETTGKVASVEAEQGYGFLVTPDGEEIYFHRNSVAGTDFDRLTVGDEVRFVVHPGEGEKGAQASSVIPTGRAGRGG